ncbi:hypothetical protein MBOU_14930 [Mycobacterium bourgelatii]|uniref:Uncharacterized protein n=1 Tax=Mycobacterium bourgelatii TaxID=1273442 RepID=A0A7I9YL95_MYCBU|nr:hypothetical protein MBOU_14930 [Mycobacterium bourgelatii]
MGAAAAALASLIVDARLAKSDAAVWTNSGTVNTNDITNLLAFAISLMRAATLPRDGPNLMTVWRANACLRLGIC